MTYSIHTAQEHIDTLQTFGLTPEAVATKLVDVIARAEGIYQEQFIRTEEYDLFLSANPEGNLEVSRPYQSIFDNPLQITVKCDHCWKWFNSPFDYTITNKGTNKTIRVGSDQFHMIKNHHYFQLDGWSPIDPVELSQVIGLV